MRIAFSTLGCPSWTLREILANAQRYGYDGVEIRGIGEDLDITKMPEFGAGIADTSTQFADAGIELTCVDTSVRAFSESKEQRAAGLDEIARYAQICPHFDTPFIRVFGGEIGDVDRKEAVDRAAGNLRDMAQIAAAHGCRIVIETHDAWITGSDVASLLDSLGDDRVGVLWDTHHTYRMGNESPSETWRVLGERVWATHLKDSVFDPGAEDESAYCLTGDGDIPLREIVSQLQTSGYSGYLTFEWEKRWEPGLPEPEVALPHFATKMRQLT